MPQFQIDDVTLQRHADALMEMGEKTGMPAPEWALILHITSQLMMERLDIEIHSTEMIFDSDETEH